MPLKYFSSVKTEMHEILLSSYAFAKSIKFIFSLVAILILVYAVVQLLEIEKEKNKIIKVQITIDKKCEFFDNICTCI